MKRGSVIVLLLLCSFLLRSQNNMQGTEFWLSFEKGYVIYVWEAKNIYDTLNLQIRVVANDQAARGSIYFTNLDDSVAFSVAPYSVFTHDLTIEQMYAVCNDTMGTSNLSVHITSDNPVSVYALNQSKAVTDATNVLPVTVLGTDYYYFSYGEHNENRVIVATQNNTGVYFNGVRYATLNRGEVYCYIWYHSVIKKDFTGTHITVDKPVAIFNTVPGVFIPDQFPAADNLFEQIPPVNTWGKNFFVPVSNRIRDFVRIVASENGTTISQTGAVRIVTDGAGQTTLNNLNAGQWVELEVSLDSNGCYIQADKPVGVCTYLAGCTYTVMFTGDTISDPAMAWLSPIEQRVKLAVVAPFIPTGNTNLNMHRALLVTPTSSKDSTTVKIGNGTEQALSSGRWYDHSSGYSFYDVQLTNDTAAYLFTNNKGGLIVMAYGTGYAESYYYLAASAMRNLEAVFYVNNIHYQEISSEFICDQPVRFRAEVQGEMSTDTGHLRWYINGVEEVAARDSLTWSKTMADGVYQIKMVILYEDNLATQTLETSITIASVSIAHSSDTMLCITDTIRLIGMPQGGRWESTNPTVATVDSAGIVTGSMDGTAEIKYVFQGMVCTDSASIMLTVYPSPIVNLDTSVLCVGNTIQLSSNTDGIWLSSDSSIATITNKGLVSGQSAGKATFIFTSSSGCSTVTGEIEVKPLPTVDVITTPDTCGKKNGTITLTVHSEEPTTVTYRWDGLTDTTSTLTGLKTGTYNVIISDTFCTITERIDVEFIPGPVAEFEANPQTANQGEEIQFIDKSSSGGGKLIYWYWNFGDSTNSNLQNPTHTYTTVTNYIPVLLKIEDEFGCRDSIIHEVLILTGIEFPNVFSPIGSDGKQYFFRPLEDKNYFKEFQIAVYNRWGNLVWQNSCKEPDCPNYNDSFWWDGSNKFGKPVSCGVYYWVVKATPFSANKKPVIKNGSVTVIK